MTVIIPASYPPKPVQNVVPYKKQSRVAFKAPLARSNLILQQNTYRSFFGRKVSMKPILAVQIDAASHSSAETYRYVNGVIHRRYIVLGSPLMMASSQAITSHVDPGFDGQIMFAVSPTWTSINRYTESKAVWI
jgi:hypothetical protein